MVLAETKRCAPLYTYPTAATAKRTDETVGALSASAVRHATIKIVGTKTSQERKAAQSHSAPIRFAIAIPFRIVHPLRSGPAGLIVRD